MQKLDFEMLIKRSLRTKKMTMTELAQMLDISLPYCSDIVRGNRSAQHIRKKICKILEIKQED